LLAVFLAPCTLLPLIIPHTTELETTYILREDSAGWWGFRYDIPRKVVFSTDEFDMHAVLTAGLMGAWELIVPVFLHSLLRSGI
jgi:hypothetical protein